ncbi:glycosyltransferase [Azorhizobium doebereinerae]|uniref:glycosyltransferase n=1 Tax=Azorhizobium doebereinerae TaxID=281091 RepID=UPI000401B30B|nr:glycosyltransferase [Azorhizobium doebereinerae]
MVGEAARDRKRTMFADPAPPPRFPATARFAPPLPVELDALRGHVAPELLAWAHARARALRVGGDEVLICAGHLSPDAACARAAAHLGLGVDPLTALPFPPALTPDVLRLGTILAPRDDGDAVYTFAARGLALRRLARALKRDPDLAARARLVPPERFHLALARHGAAGIGAEAAFGLRTRAPDLSAALLTPSRRLLPPLALGAATFVALTATAPLATLLAVEGLLSAVFLGGAALRLGACFVKAPREVPLGLGGADLPPYSVIVPLYREVRVLPRLVAALRRLDYPPEKLDIKLVIEPDDAPMRAALRRMALPPWFAVVVAPAVGPRTKPKALNAALPFARGRYVAVFDAEDVPAPDQLRRALAAFRGAGPAVACVQARLTVENAEDSWISRHFAAEYAGHFDVLLPALASLGLPILLGGTSNHFRRDRLEAVGAWDPYNVTEDADLGVRLARAGWATAVIASSTEEEAPISRQAWMGQRTRWLKGWAQTLLVHGREPRRLGRDLGWGNMAALALLTAGPFASALVHPLCLVVLAADIARGVFLMPSGSALGVAVTALSATNLAVGYLAAGLCCGLGLRRRGRLALAPVLLGLPLYWLFQSAAAWRAVVQLVVRPHWWDKTEHGLGRRRPVPGRRRHMRAVAAQR